MQSTLGFSPVVPCNNRWSTRVAKQEFTTRVARQLQHRLGEPVDVTYADVADFLHRATTNVSAGARDIDDAVLCAVLTLEGRAKMRGRLRQMQEQPVQNQPRGCDGRDKSELRRPAMHGSPFYAKFLGRGA